MKRVSFLLQRSQNTWLGGLSYLRNLLRAVFSNPNRRIDPVLLAHPQLEEENLIGFPSIEIIRTYLVSQRNPARFAGRVVSGLICRDLVLEWILRKHRVEVLSHSIAVGAKSDIASIAWIPDFQHIRMPQFFSQREREGRDRHFLQLARESSRIILSSHDALRDLISFAPFATEKACVLQFVSSFENVGMALTRERLCQRFGIDRPFFHLPNQFWVHKDHSVVIEAVSILRKQGYKPLVLATGLPLDHRNPNYFEELMSRTKKLGIEDSFRALGVVALPELLSLMLNSLSLINPSRFEGWSTSVEESKSLGVPIILSDIPVHLEQAPPLGRYFKTGSAEELANAMLAAMREFDPFVAITRQNASALALPDRIRQFGRSYEDIVSHAIVDGFPKRSMSSGRN
jgi:glycosyltransferase involved in cell wall biosynthesis